MRRAILALLIPTALGAQIRIADHRAAADQLIAAALRYSAAHARLSLLVDGFGHRMTGS
jgi:hypothetical protein